MTSTLQQHVQEVARRARQLMRLYGIGWFLALAGLVVLVAGVLDWLVRFHDSGVRWIVFLLVCGLLGWCFYRFVYRTLRYHCSDLHAARKIESCFPVLNDRLSSAVVFASQSPEEPLAGSMQLRQAVILETEAALGQLDVSRCLDYRSPRRAAVIAAVVGLVLGGVMLAFGTEARLAGQRLLMPWSEVQWPRRHVLMFLNPVKRVALQKDVEWTLIDARGQLPDHIQFQYWVDGDDPSQIQTEALQPMGDRVLHRRTGITKGFRYRATGGDDRDMPWRHIDVVAPPKVVKSELILHPPAYTALPEQTTEGPFHALGETEVTLHVRVDKVLSVAELATDTTAEPVSMPLQIDADGLGCTLPGDGQAAWRIIKSGTYGFRFVDALGLDAGIAKLWHIRMVRDKPPSVSVQRPTEDQQVARNAVVPIQATATDDLAVAEITIHYQRSEPADHEPTPILLWRGSDQAPSIEPSGSDEVSAEGKHHSIRYVWDLSSIPNLGVAQTVAFRVAATDYKPQQGLSAARRLVIVSTEQIIDRLQRRQSELLAQIAEILNGQRQTRLQTESNEIQLKGIGAPDRDGIDALQSIELNQRQVRQRLAHSTDNILSRCDELLDQLKINRIDSPETTRRLDQVRSTISRLDKAELPRIEHALLDGVKTARQTLEDHPESAGRQPAPPRLVQAIHTALGDQALVIETLEDLLGRLAQWDNYQHLARELRQVRQKETDLHARTEQLQLRIVTKSLAELVPQERTELRQLAEHQSEVARQFDRLQARMEQTRDNLRKDDPTASATLAEALDVAGRQGLSGTMHDVGRDLQTNRFSEATRRQETVDDVLREMLDILANRREHRADKLAQQLDAAAHRLQELRRRQQGVRQKLDQTTPLGSAELKQVEKQESQLSGDVKRLAEQLSRLQNSGTDKMLDRAAQHLEQAAQAADRKQPIPLRQHADQAERQMKQADTQLQKALKKAHQILEKQRQLKLRQILSDLVSGQSHVLQQTRQLDLDRAQATNPQDPESDGRVRMLAQHQRELHIQTLELIDMIKPMRAFVMALDEVAQGMTQAEQQLEQLQTGKSTQTIELLCLKRLEQLQTALKIEPTVPNNRPKKPSGDNKTPKPANQPKKQGDQSILLAQLKLILMMQQEINDQTRQLEIDRKAGNWSETMTRRQQTLVQRQGELADILFQLLQR